MDVSNNPLDSTEFLERLRADWAKQCNLMLPEGVRIDHRSLEAQGIERIPTIHEGHASRESPNEVGTASSMQSTGASPRPTGT